MTRQRTPAERQATIDKLNAVAKRAGLVDRISKGAGGAEQRLLVEAILKSISDRLERLEGAQGGTVAKNGRRPDNDLRGIL